MAVIIGKPDYSGQVTVRLPSACLTGDLFGSLKCDCGDQLRHTVRFMAQDLTQYPSSVQLGEENMVITQKRIARIVVEGAVQGVGYRVFVAREAGRLHLDGWVRNRRDGSVETLVAGPNAAVEEFLIAALRGPRTAFVASHRIEAADEAALREGGGGHGFVVAGEA